MIVRYFTMSKFKSKVLNNKLKRIKDIGKSQQQLEEKDITHENIKIQLMNRYNDRLKLYNQLTADIQKMTLEKRKATFGGLKFDDEQYNVDKNRIVDKYKREVYIIDKDIEKLNKGLK